MAWDDGLEQGSAVYDIAIEPRSPIHVLAGPGTGKSTALKLRVGRLLDEGISPEAILAVTFTRTSARDLLNDLSSVGVPGCDKVRACTLHSLCFSILQRQHVLGAIERVPRVLMEFEKTPILRDLMRSQYGGLDARRKRLKAYEAAWARLQHDEPGWPQDETDRDFQRDLTDWLLFHECILLGELVPLALVYLRNNPLSPVRRVFQHILVDEYQDLNRADQVTIDLLAEEADVMVVGDDDQSIFGSLRYVNREGITQYPSTHQGCVSKTLDECVRCPSSVVRMANHFIAYEHARPERRLRESQCNGQGDVHVLQWNSVEEEASGLARLIDSYVRSHEISPKEVLVLSPWRKTGYRIRDELIAVGRNACSYFQEEALDSVESKERFAILTLLSSPEDRASLRYLLGIGSPDNRGPAYARLRSHCETTGVSPWRALEQMSTGELVIPNQRRLRERFLEIREKLEFLLGTDMDRFVDVWLGVSAETAELRGLSEQVLNEPRISQLRDEWISGPVGENPKFIGSLHDEVHTRISQPELPSDESVIKVMSLHKSKGLSADLVVVAGCVTGWIPRVDRRATPAEQIERLDEQRRLFYVALTRTRNCLILSSAVHMSGQEALESYARVVAWRGRMARVQASTFLGQLGPCCPPGVSGTAFLAEVERLDLATRT